MATVGFKGLIYKFWGNCRTTAKLNAKASSVASRHIETGNGSDLQCML